MLDIIIFITMHFMITYYHFFIIIMKFVIRNLNCLYLKPQFSPINFKFIINIYYKNIFTPLLIIVNFNFIFIFNLKDHHFSYFIILIHLITVI